MHVCMYACVYTERCTDANIVFAALRTGIRVPQIEILVLYLCMCAYACVCVYTCEFVESRQRWPHAACCAETQTLFCVLLLSMFPKFGYGEGIVVCCVCVCVCACVCMYARVYMASG